LGKSVGTKHPYSYSVLNEHFVELVDLKDDINIFPAFVAPQEVAQINFCDSTPPSVALSMPPWSCC
jgi:hypothetical protein